MAKLIVGLGNPGQEYQNSRHNIGFIAIEHMASYLGEGNFKYEKRLDSEVTQGKIGKSKAIFIKPQTFMNESGKAVKRASTVYKIKPKDILVIQDDLDIAFGNSKLSFARGSAGHRGIESIIKSLKTEKFWRLRLGTASGELNEIRNGNLGRAKKIKLITDFVISDFTPSEQKKLDKIIKAAAQKLAVDFL